MFLHCKDERSIQTYTPLHAAACIRKLQSSCTSNLRSVIRHHVVSTICTDAYLGHNLNTALHRNVGVYLPTSSSHATMQTAVKRSHTWQHHLQIQAASFIALPSMEALSYTKLTSASTSRNNRHSLGNDKRNAALFTGKITTHCIQVTGPIAAFAWQ